MGAFFRNNSANQNRMEQVRLLMECVKNGDLEEVMQYETILNGTDEYDHTALHHACLANNNLELVEYLIQHPLININQISKGSRHALHIAIKTKCMELVRLLVFSPKGCHIEARDMLCRTPLFYAVHQNSADLVKLLLECGANPNVIDKNGKTIRSITNDPAILDLLNGQYIRF